MNKLFPKKRWQQYLLLGTVLLTLFIAIQMSIHFFHAKQQPIALNTMLVQMRSDPVLWTNMEHDVSVLIIDMQKNRVAGAAIAPAGIFMTTKAGQKYFVSDYYGKFAEMVLASYHKGQTDTFPLAVLAKDPRGVYDWRSDIGLVLTLCLFAAIFVYGYRTLGEGFKFSQNNSAVTFKDVIGAHEAKAALLDIMAYLKDPQGFAEIGARPPKGVLLSGPPGTGKTQLAKALAGECNVNFIAATGGDFTAMFLGVGSMRVKSLFRKARKNAPCIVFIDEVDGIDRRTTTDNGGPAEAEGNRIINQILAEIDGFNASSGVIVIGATNYPDAVDPALLREGRFDRKIHVKLPDVQDREALFRLYAQKVKAMDNIGYAQLARLTTGLTPAAIAYVVNHAALISTRSSEKQIGMDNFLEAIEVCRMGEINGSATAMTEAERERVAVHEAGHAIVAQVLGVGVVEKVTILPRGGALGVTLVTQSEDKQLHLKSEMKNRIQMLLGGRAAEIIRYDDASSGAASDLKEASRLALSMVASLGLGDKGTLFSMDALAVFNITPDTTLAVAEAEGILVKQNECCFAILQQYKEAFRAVVARLLERETIHGIEVVEAVAAVQKDLELDAGERRDPGSPMRLATAAEEIRQRSLFQNPAPNAVDSFAPAA